MPQCVLQRAVKVGGTRYGPGTLLDVSDEIYAQLVVNGAALRVPSTPPPPPVVKIPRTAAEKQAALDEAQARVKSAE